MKLESQKEERGHGIAVMCEDRMPETFAKTDSHEDPRKISCGLDRKKERVILLKNTECLLYNLLSREKKNLSRTSSQVREGHLYVTVVPSRISVSHTGEISWKGDPPTTQIHTKI